MSKHRTRVAVREDFNKPWSLRIWRNPNKKFQIVQCEICHPKKVLGPKKDGRIFEFDSAYS